MDTANPPGGGRRVRTAPSKRLRQEEAARQEEDARLIAAGFKPVDQGDRLLWVKGDGIYYYGRVAALQAVKREEGA
jgi:hypothetical protein